APATGWRSTTTSTSSSLEISSRPAQLFRTPRPTNGSPLPSEGSSDMRTPHLALLGAALLTGTLTLACGGDDDPQARTQSIDSSTDAGGGTATTKADGDGD